MGNYDEDDIWNDLPPVVSQRDLEAIEKMIEEEYGKKASVALPAAASTSQPQPPQPIQPMQRAGAEGKRVGSESRESERAKGERVSPESPAQQQENVEGKRVGSGSTSRWRMEGKRAGPESPSRQWERGERVRAESLGRGRLGGNWVGSESPSSGKWVGSESPGRGRVEGERGGSESPKRQRRRLESPKKEWKIELVSHLEGQLSQLVKEVKQRLRESDVEGSEWKKLLQEYLAHLELGKEEELEVKLLNLRESEHESPSSPDHHKKRYTSEPQEYLKGMEPGRHELKDKLMNLIGESEVEGAALDHLKTVYVSQMRELLKQLELQKDELKGMVLD